MRDRHFPLLQKPLNVQSVPQFNHEKMKETLAFDTSDIQSRILTIEQLSLFCIIKVSWELFPLFFFTQLFTVPSVSVSLVLS